MGGRPSIMMRASADQHAIARSKSPALRAETQSCRSFRTARSTPSGSPPASVAQKTVTRANRPRKVVLTGASLDVATSIRSAQDKELPNLTAELDDLAQTVARQPADLLVERDHRREEVEQVEEVLPHVLVPRVPRVELRHACLQHLERGVDLAALTLVQDPLEGLPHVLRRGEMVAPVAEHVRDLDDPPALQFAKARAHVRARHREGLYDVLCVERLRRYVEQRVHLGDRAVDPPTGAHLTPVEDEPLHYG